MTMRTPIRLPGRTRLLSPLTAAALAASLLSPLGATGPVAASVARPQAAPLAAPVAPGPVTGTSCTPSCDLYAAKGTLTLPDAMSYRQIFQRLNRSRSKSVSAPRSLANAIVLPSGETLGMKSP